MNSWFESTHHPNNTPSSGPFTRKPLGIWYYQKIMLMNLKKCKRKTRNTLYCSLCGRLLYFRLYIFYSPPSRGSQWMFMLCIYSFILVYIYLIVFIGLRYITVKSFKYRRDLPTFTFTFIHHDRTTGVVVPWYSNNQLVVICCQLGLHKPA